MSQFADDNRSFILTIKELPKIIASIGYEPIDPRLINSRSGVFITLMALLRLSEVHTNKEVLAFVTAKLGKDLAIDPYELLTPADYREASGSRKLAYRTVADTRAFSMINKLVNDSKALNRELVNLTHLDDLLDKVEYLCGEATLTFKRIVSLKEYSFGGAYLLDEDVYEHLNSFSVELTSFSILTTSSGYYRELIDFITDEGKQCNSPTKLEHITNNVIKKYFIPAHESVISLASHVLQNIDAETKRVNRLKESIGFVEEFVLHIKSSGTEEFDPSVFAIVGVSLSMIIQAYELDLAAVKECFQVFYKGYMANVAPAIQEHGNVNPSYIAKIATKQHSLIDKFSKDLDRYVMFNSENEFRRTFVAIGALYSTLSSKYLENRSFRDSVGKSFKFKKMIKK